LTKRTGFFKGGVMCKEYIYFDALKNELFILDYWKHRSAQMHLLIAAYPYPGCWIAYIGEL
jgi:hypothetical protein